MKVWSQEHLKKVIHPNDLSKKVKEFKLQGKSIATLNGSFDLLHAGHLQIIYEASQQADLLIVALNSDESIKKYKSINRPIIPLNYRLEMICALEFVNYATWFNETDPCLLLQEILPNVHINGSEYGEDCIEADVVKAGGGKIHIVKLIPGLSTSEIIKKLVQLHKSDIKGTCD